MGGICTSVKKKIKVIEAKRINSQKSINTDNNNSIDRHEDGKDNKNEEKNINSNRSKDSDMISDDEDENRGNKKKINQKMIKIIFLIQIY
jgi:hypothetical protein